MQDWLNYFHCYVGFKLLDKRSSLALFAMLMHSTVNMWFTNLADETCLDFGAVLEHFEEKYVPASISLWRRTFELFSHDQRPTETIEECYSDMMRKAQAVKAADEMTCYAIMRGLRPELSTYIMQQKPTPAAELRSCEGD